MRHRTRTLRGNRSDCGDDNFHRGERAPEHRAGRHGRKRLAEWLDLARQGALAALAEALVEEHYDPAYERYRRAEDRPPPR